ncbi:glycosyltransferase [Paenibacillus sp. NPDC058071]|uniref:glycosyltransferase n=1 Tax=Paenibacillus sp. NPDC058071 TaxID=3346326 RepID=UPI0036DB063E
MLLGVHIIAFNEADVLDRCLASVRDIADELLVGDTGSTDETSAIAAAYGASVVRVDWQDDFAAARNALLQRARTVWVLVIDADEWLVGDRKALRDELHQIKETALKLSMEHLLDNDGSTAITSEAVRLFRTDQAYRFDGEIHEQLVQTTEERGFVQHKSVDGQRCKSSVKLFHDGYKPENVARKKKAERNFRIITRQLSNRPNDPFCLYNYGVTLCQLGRVKEAAEVMAKALDTAPVQAPYRATLVRDYAKTLMEIGQNAQAVEWLTRESLGYPDYSELHYLLGQCYLALGMLPDACAAFEAATATHCDTELSYIAEKGSGDCLPLTAWGEALLQLGDLPAANKRFEGALAAVPGWEPAIIGIAHAMHMSGKSDEDIDEMSTAFLIKKDEADVLSARARVLTAVGAYRLAAPLWLAAIDSKQLQKTESGEGVSTAAKPADLILAAEALIGEGNLSKAEVILNQAFEAREQATGNELAIIVADKMLCRWAHQEIRPADKSEDDLLSTFRPLMGGREYEWLKEMNARLTSDSPAEIPILPDAACLAWASAWQDRAVRHGLLDLAIRLSTVWTGLSSELSIQLYDHGFLELAAECMLLEYEHTGKLDGEQAYRLGELLYQKRNFNEALALLEQAAEAPRRDAASMRTIERARLGAASACLQLALQALSPEEYSGSRSWDGSWAVTDKERLSVALQRTESCGWQTNWRGVQRRRANEEASETGFLVHDR